MGTDADVDPVAAVEFLARSRTRVRVLSELASEGRLTRDELGRRVDASRTTIGRNLDALEDRGWVTEVNRECAITRVGEWIAEDFAALVETVASATELAPVFEHLDAADLGVDLRGAEVSVTTPDPGDPMKPVNRHVSNLRRAERSRVLLPVVGMRAVEAVHERVTVDGAETEGVVAPAVAETLRTDPEYREYFEEMQATEGFAFYVYDGEIPYYLGILDGRVELGVDDDGQPAALLETEAPRVREWAERTYESFREDAKPLEPREV